MELYVRLAERADTDRVMAVIGQGRAYLKRQGSPQWQDGEGPNREAVLRDVQRREGCVLLYEGRISGYAALAAGVEESYAGLSQGQWQGGYDAYVTIHRVALEDAARGRGLARQFLRDLVIIARAAGYCDIRVDTHPMNKIMQRVILGAGFTYRGMVTLPIANGERLAYQMILP